jgi:chromosome segregation ATPase
VSEAPQALPERDINGRFLPQRSSERQKLAEAIDSLGALNAQLDRLQEARGRLDWGGKDRAHTAARRALDEARRRAPQILVAKAMGEAYDPTTTVDHAQGLLEDSRRDLDEATATDKIFADEIAVVEQRRAVAQIRRERVLAEVVRAAPEVAALHDRVERARQALDDLGWILSAIGGHRLPFHWNGSIAGRDTGQGAPWKAALIALESDPDAELPSE